MNKLINIILLFVLFNAVSAHADAVSRLQEFDSGTRSLSAKFTQTVHDRNGKLTQTSHGSMQFLRPGKFRWTYEKPYSQVIVGDGKRLWIYDQDLEQVTVRKLDRAIGESPAALLAGSKEIETHFLLKDAGDREGLEWLDATPKSKEGSFERVSLGFKGIELHAMEVRDNFGQTTQLRFSRIRRNVTLPASYFIFNPPKGVDLIGDED